MKYCFHCGKELPEDYWSTGNYFFLAVDRPYGFLLFHKDCWLKVNENFYSYFTKHAKKVYNYIREMEKNNGKTRKNKRK